MKTSVHREIHTWIMFIAEREPERSLRVSFFWGGGSLFYKGKNPLQEGSTFKTPNHFPKSPPPNTITYGIQIRSDQSLSRVWLFATPWIVARQASLSITNSGVHWDSSSHDMRVHRVSDAIQPSHPLLSPSSPAPNPSHMELGFNKCILEGQIFSAYLSLLILQTRKLKFGV